MHSQPIENRIDWLFEHARKHSEVFVSPEASLARKRYLAEHPTAIMVLKCMDGRINLPVATNTQMGIIQPFRNLGGRFDLGWPHLGEVLAHHVQDVVGQGRRVLAIITYHFSKGDPRRGCAGFDFDTEAARAHTEVIKRQVEHVFGAGHATVYPLVCGFETDDDALILHGDNGAFLDVSTLTQSDLAQLPTLLHRLYPDMPDQIRRDIEPLMVGNLAHLSEIKRSGRELDIEHREWMICIGRGFDWLHMPNLALIIGPYSPDLGDPVRKAANIIRTNMQKGRIPDDGFLLLATVPYTEIGMDKARAELKSRFMCAFAASVIQAADPGLAARMHQRTAILNWRSRALEILPT